MLRPVLKRHCETPHAIQQRFTKRPFSISVYFGVCMKPTATEWKNSIVVTGANGFIGMNLVEWLLVKGFQTGSGEVVSAKDIMVIGVDLAESLERPLANRFSGSARYRFLTHVDFLTEIDQLNEFCKPLVVFHNGACSSTTETRQSVFDTLNTGYSERVWEACTKLQIPLIYASSAATYGDGLKGFLDTPEKLNEYVPLNLYGKSKLDFDKFAATQEQKNAQFKGSSQNTKSLCPPHWFGLRYFNVYGPYERHKGGQASMVMHGYDQITRTGKINLFESNSPNYSAGNQVRDFIYVKDIVKYSLLLAERALNGSFPKNCFPNSWSGCFVNLGTGTARTWNSLAQNVAVSMNMNPKIEYIPIPSNIASQYQNFTEANLNTLKKLGIPIEFTSLEDGVKETVQRYLCRGF
jgi:ADP-L-glycero-D-manno-heptose 6-epimerase